MLGTSIRVVNGANVHMVSSISRSLVSSHVEVMAKGGNDKVQTIEAGTRATRATPMKIYGQGGNDMLIGGSGNDVLLGGSGNDTIRAGDGADWLDGGDGNDALYGQKGNDNLTGGLGPDFIDGGEGLDRLRETGADSRYYLSNSYFLPGSTALSVAQADSLKDVETAQLYTQSKLVTVNARDFSGWATLSSSTSTEKSFSSVTYAVGGAMRTFLLVSMRQEIQTRYDQSASIRHVGVEHSRRSLGRRAASAE